MDEIITLDDKIIEDNSKWLSEGDYLQEIEVLNFSRSQEVYPQKPFVGFNKIINNSNGQVLRVRGAWNENTLTIPNIPKNPTQIVLAEFGRGLALTSTFIYMTYSRTAAHYIAANSSLSIVQGNQSYTLYNWDEETNVLTINKPDTSFHWNSPLVWIFY